MVDYLMAETVRLRELNVAQPSVGAELGCRELFHQISKLGASLELNDLLGRDVHGFAGLRVAAFTGGSF